MQRSRSRPNSYRRITFGVWSRCLCRPGVQGVDEKIWFRSVNDRSGRGGANSTLKQNDEGLKVAGASLPMLLYGWRKRNSPLREDAQKGVRSSSLLPGMEKWHPASRGWERRFASQDGSANCRERPSTCYRYRDRGFARQSCERSRRARRW